jgi:hypothetical protein
VKKEIYLDSIENKRYSASGCYVHVDEIEQNYTTLATLNWAVENNLYEISNKDHTIQLLNRMKGIDLGDDNQGNPITEIDLVDFIALPEFADQTYATKPSIYVNENYNNNVDLKKLLVSKMYESSTQGLYEDFVTRGLEALTITWNTTIGTTINSDINVQLCMDFTLNLDMVSETMLALKISKLGIYTSFSKGGFKKVYNFIKDGALTGYPVTVQGWTLQYDWAANGGIIYSSNRDIVYGVEENLDLDNPSLFPFTVPTINSTWTVSGGTLPTNSEIYNMLTSLKGTLFALTPYIDDNFKYIFANMVLKAPTHTNINK